MKVHQVVLNFEAETHTVDALPNEKLSALLSRAGVLLPLVCGGNGTCGACKVLLLGGGEVRSCQHTITSDMQIVLSNQNATVQSLSHIKETFVFGNRAKLALDIGTTTIALALVDAKTLDIVEVVVFNNPQAVFGADVITRIKNATCNNRKEMQSSLIKEINCKLSYLMERYCITQFETMLVSGNTVMLHLFLGKDVYKMGYAPYSPTFVDVQTLQSGTVGLYPEFELKTFPCVSAFVGGDVVSGILASGFPKQGKKNILIDLGTNAEIAIYDSASCLVTAAAAGPCFEGASITCGMSATDGAICAFRMHGNSKESTVIGGGTAKGICGSGLIDVVASMLEHNIIDENGTFLNVSSFELTDGICISQADIRQFQLAKAAVCAGLETLIKQANVLHEEIEYVFLTGGFSSSIHIENAVLCGLLPKNLLDKCVSLGNTSLKGACISTYDMSIPNQIASMSRYVDLSEDARFSETFIQQMGFENRR